jgi:hypothetical protein
MSAVSLGWNCGREIMDTEFLCDQDMFIKYQKFGMELTAFHLLSLVCTFLTSWCFFLLNQIVLSKCVVVTAQQARIVYSYSEYLQTLCLAVFCLCVSLASCHLQPNSFVLKR